MREDFSKSEELICRELSNHESLSVTELSRRTNLPTWKVSRKLKRLEIRDIVQHEVENRHKRGRPRKFYEIRSDASNPFTKGGKLDE